MSVFNLSSPTRISQHCNFDDLDAWMRQEIRSIKEPAIRKVVATVCQGLPEFIEWPKKAVLLWASCDRIREKGKAAIYHRYPEPLIDLFRRNGIQRDTRANGPAIASYLLAGGNRPRRKGSSNAWSIHHIYSGKFPYHESESTLHAKRDGLHFTQSAGLIAAHPIADAICDEFPAFAWRLRAEAFSRFGYDPDGVFSSKQDKYGFGNGCRSKVIFRRGAIRRAPAVPSAQ